MDLDMELVAINHDETAIETHQANHPDARQLNTKVEGPEPSNILNPNDVNVIIAAPECTHFSSARGGKPVKEQKRASPMHVLDWVGKLQPEALLLENVPEFRSWGPIVDGEPTRDGSKFEQWKRFLESDRYSVKHTTLNAANYGDPTSRRRFFVIARRDYEPEFPDPTHSENGEEPGTEPWQTAAEVIDFSDRGDSIWTRSRPLVSSTMERIAAGIRNNCDDSLSPFADVIEDLDAVDVESMQQNMVHVDKLEATIEQRERPFLVHGPTQVPEDPTELERAELCVPMIMGQHSNAVAKDASECPTPTIAKRGAIHFFNPDPFVLPRNGPQRGLHSNPAYKPENRPFHTVTAKNHDGHLVSPFLIEYYGQSTDQSLEEPVPTVTTKDRHALIVPELYPWGLDIQYRMLQPRELKAAQGFPDDYHIAGNKTETTKQIGNAVPVSLAKALCKQLLLPTSQPTISRFDHGESSNSTALQTGDT
jgi:DNA (cytosine-5)-methyltransferase 1